MRTHRHAAYVLSAAALLLCVTASLLVGTDALSGREALAALTGVEASPAARLIMFGVRLPRVLAALCCGAALAISGGLLQTALDNDLASPGVMGVNAGAGLFALVASLAFPFSALARAGMALVGALVSTAIVALVSRRAGAARATLVLAGVATSSLMGAGTNAIITLWPHTVTDKVAFSMGGLAGVTMAQLALAAPIMAVGLGCAFLLAPGLGLLALGDETAQGLGLDVKKWRTLAIVNAAGLAAAAVSVCGLLGFIGLMVPNLVRMVCGTGLRHSFVHLVLWGPILLVVCDLAARVLFFPYELPCGLLLSCLGAPFFIFLLVRRGRRR